MDACAIVCFYAALCCCSTQNKETMKAKIAFNLCLFLLLAGRCSTGETEISKPEVDMEKLRKKAASAKAYCERNNLNTDFYILVDMSMHSGLKRFFIWNFNTQSVSNSFLVSHGCCQNPWGGDYSKNKAGFSNEDGSHCSSVGKYIIGERGYSNWGINVKYLLHGQEATNRSAAKRQIVLHGWDRVSDEDVYPSGAPEGWGCPAISNNSMRIVDKKLKNACKKTLLWIIQD